MAPFRMQESAVQVNLSIKAVPQLLADQLRRRAERNHRSLQGELMAIIERAAAEVDALPGNEAHPVAAVGPAPAAPVPPGTSAGAGPHQPIGAGDVVDHGWKSLEQLLAERRESGWQPHPLAATAPLGVEIIRADRDRR